MYKKSKRRAAWARYYAKQPPEWHVWLGMKKRCYYPKHVSYSCYGGKGITVCSRWLEHGSGFKNFLEDMGKRPLGCSLDRIDSDKGYYKENCRWLSNVENFGRTGTRSESEEVPF
jgi:hypothetical protein